MTPEWLADPKLWILVAGLIGQWAVTQWRLGANADDIRKLEADLDGDIRRLETDVDSLREWRAQATEKFRHIEAQIEK